MCLIKHDSRGEESIVSDGKDNTFEVFLLDLAPSNPVTSYLIGHLLC